MQWGDLKDKFSSFFKITSFLFGPYLKLKYEPKENKTIEEYLHLVVVYAGSWLIVVLVYVFFVYLFIFQREDGTTGALKDFFTRPPIDIIIDTFTAFKTSPFFNISFLVVLYFAITYHAERTFLAGRVLHLNLCGLIKTITLGRFDISSQVSEQADDQVQFARLNIHKTANDGTKEFISIVTASGWDLFGDPVIGLNPAGKDSKKWPWSKSSPLPNGYLIDVIAQQFRKVQIVLLDPDGEYAKSRGAAYLEEGAHKPISSAADYAEGVRKVIRNIKIAYKRNKNIELKLIDSQLQWKMIIVEGEAWVQPVIHGIRSDHTPLYGFNKREFSMYHAFWHLNEAIWHDKNSKTVDLTEP